MKINKKALIKALGTVAAFIGVFSAFLTISMQFPFVYYIVIGGGVVAILVFYAYMVFDSLDK